MSDNHPRFRTREHWEKCHAKAREILRKLFILNETKTLSPIEIMDLRKEAAAKLNDAFPEIERDATILPSWITPMMTDDAIFVGLEVDVLQFFDAVMSSYDDAAIQLKAQTE